MAHIDRLWVSCANLLAYRLTALETERQNTGEKSGGNNMPAKMADL